MSNAISGLIDSSKQFLEQVSDGVTEDMQYSLGEGIHELNEWIRTSIDNFHENMHRLTIAESVQNCSVSPTRKSRD